MAAATGATMPASADGDGVKPAAADHGLDHQACTAHAVRNTEAWGSAIVPGLAANADRSLAAIGVEPARAVANCHAPLE